MIWPYWFKRLPFNPETNVNDRKEQMSLKQSFLFLLTGFIALSCSPQFRTPKDMEIKPHLTNAGFISFDGTELPLKTWLPAAPCRAVFVCLHGYNDYSNFIRDAALFFKNNGIAIYAYDQRGFGRTSNTGKWAGRKAMCKDMEILVSIIQKRHPDAPLYLLGNSMGGALIMATEKMSHLPVDGVILTAPAVWARTTMPCYQRWAIGFAARTMPWVKVSAKNLDITPSDNTEMLKALGRDPLVIKESRIDSIYGLANLMDTAYESAFTFDQNVLFLYGARDEIIPPKPMAKVFSQRLNGFFSNPQRLIVYPEGYHMLLRDLHADIVWKDILFWLKNPDGEFPSVIQKAAYEIKSEEDIRRFIYPARREQDK